MANTIHENKSVLRPFMSATFSHNTDHAHTKRRNNFHAVYFMTNVIHPSFHKTHPHPKLCHHIKMFHGIIIIIICHWICEKYVPVCVSSSTTCNHIKPCMTKCLDGQIQVCKDFLSWNSRTSPEQNVALVKDLGVTEITNSFRKIQAGCSGIYLH